MASCFPDDDAPVASAIPHVVDSPKENNFALFEYLAREFRFKFLEAGT